MTPDDALNSLANRFGILSEFRDLSGNLRSTSRDTQLALLRAAGLTLDNDAMVVEALAQHRAQENARHFPREVIIRRGENLTLDSPEDATWQLQLDGTTHPTFSGVCKDSISLPCLPSGIHEMHIQTANDSECINVLVSPGRAPSVGKIARQEHVWGINAALYGLRSKRHSGLGNFEDLARLAETAGDQGCSFLGINPVHNLGWGDDRTFSPYSPSHRGFLNTAHIAADHILGLENSDTAQAEINANPLFTARAYATDTVDYSDHRLHQQRLLRRLFRAFKDEAPDCAKKKFTVFNAAQGSRLEQFTLFEVLSETHGPDWRRWPQNLQSPETASKHTNSTKMQDQQLFHSWLQWVADCQLEQAQDRGKRAGMAMGLYLDLAVGPRRGGAETWCETDTVARGVSIGAPPDQLSPNGQNWDLAAFAPGQLIANKYRALQQILRQSMHHAAILRIDHVLGMNRSYWIPDDGSPGGYVRQPFRSLLALVAIEAERAQTVVVGEDLGLVPSGFRKAIGASGLYSYSVLQYEKDTHGGFRKPSELRPQSLACFGTHDTPTLKGFWQGRDIDWWQKLGWIDPEQAEHSRIHRHLENRGLLSLNQDQITDTLEGRNFDELCYQVHKALANSPVAMVSVQLDDILGLFEAQNLPGTILEHPNWCRRYQIQVEWFGTNEILYEISQVMAKSGRGPQVMALKDEESEH